jgi:signal transduction histidine kinase
MDRFIERHNIERFERLLSREQDEARRRVLQPLLAQSRRRLAIYDSIAEGAYLNSPPRPRLSPGGLARNRLAIAEFQRDFEASSEPYLLLDPRPGLRIVDINDAYGRATMTHRQAIVGEGLFDVFPDNPGDSSADGVSNLHASLSLVVQTGRPHRMAIQRYDIRDGSGLFVERYWQPLNTPIFGEDDELIFLLHHVVDVTDQVIAARARPLRSAAELTRGAYPSSDRPRASELELANQRLAQFAYVASHDLQEPLRKMAVYASLLEEAVANSDREGVARATSVIKTSAVRARHLVDNLLTFSRENSSQTEERPLDLRAEVELALSDLSASIEETGGRVSVDIPLIVVPADRTQLGRLIQNVVSNAIKYRKPGASPAIDIRATLVGGAKAMLAIADNGIGFSEEFAREIFEPFKRLHDPARYVGAGIGLAICKAIADRYGWTIGVRSRPGEGATFTVTFPTAG